MNTCYYTVITKAKRDRYWRVYNTYLNSEDARFVQSAIRSNRPSNVHYYVDIKRHYKSRVELTDFQEQVVTFNDGTTASLPVRR